MDLEALRYFLEVVDSGSVLAAATSLDVARPTVRRRIEELEASAGVRLLVRSPLGVTPTEAGAVLAARARALIDDARAALGAAREVGTDPSGRLRVAAPIGMPPHVYGPLLHMLRARFPKVDVELTFSSSPAADLARGVDIALDLSVEAPSGPWIEQRLLDVSERLLATRSYLETRGTPRTAEELLEHDLLAWQPPDRDPRSWPTGRGQEIEVDPWLVSADAHFVRSTAAAGLGIAFVPDAVLPIAAPAGDDLVVVLPTIARPRAFRALVPHAVSEAPRVRGALTVLRELAAFAGSDAR